MVNACQHALQVAKGHTRGTKAFDHTCFAPLTQCFYPSLPSSLYFQWVIGLHAPIERAFSLFESGSNGKPMKGKLQSK
jgi:hypothetical protein